MSLSSVPCVVILTKRFSFQPRSVQVLAPLLSHDVLQTLELLYVQRLKANQLVLCYQRHFLGCVNPSMPAAKNTKLRWP